MELRIKIEPDLVDGGFVAEILDVPGCMAQGETEKEAFDNLGDALGGVIAAQMQCICGNGPWDSRGVCDECGGTRDPQAVIEHTLGCEWCRATEVLVALRENGWLVSRP